MNIQIISDSFDVRKFNEIAGHPMQMWEWGIARERTGVKVVRLGEFDGPDLKRVFTMTVHDIPYTSYKIAYVPRSTMPSQELVQFLTNWAKEHKVIFVKFEPYVFKNDMQPDEIHTSLKRSPHPLFPPWTQILDLTISEDDLLKNLKQKTRYNIGLARRKGVTVVLEDTDAGFQKFIDLYFQTCRRQNYFGHSREYHKIIWSALKETQAHILLAHFEGEPLAAYELFYCKNTLYYPYGGSSEKHRNLMAANLLMWEAILLGKKMGATRFDMWGSLAPGYDEKNIWSGFTRFKEGYGTTYAEFVGSYDLVVNPIPYRIYSAVYALRNSYLSFKIR